MRYNLSEITEVIRDRRTVYPEQYSTRKVHREIVENVLNNALWAPTHGMTQPWRFKVFMDGAQTELGQFMADNYKSTAVPEKFSQGKFDKYMSRMQKATVVVAICMKRQESERIPEVEEIAAVACAVQNMYLTCTAYGIGGYWSTGGGAYSDEMKGFLKLEGKDRCLGFFFMGYPEGDWPKGQRRPLEYVTEWMES
jgi:nitroreductase